MTDLFEHLETLPEKVVAAVTGLECYNDCREAHEKISKLGYTFDFGLDGVPYHLRPKNTLPQNDTPINIYPKPIQEFILDYVDRYVGYCIKYMNESNRNLTIEQAVKENLGIYGGSSIHSELDFPTNLTTAASQGLTLDNLGGPALYPSFKISTQKIIEMATARLNQLTLF